MDIVKLSKKLSYILRHNPSSANIKLDSGGWVPICDILSAMKVLWPDLSKIIKENNKKRFELNKDETHIRACQGHSIPIDLGLESKIPPEILYHGTSENFLESIFKLGLSLQICNISISFLRQSSSTI